MDILDWLPDVLDYALQQLDVPPAVAKILSWAIPVIGTIAIIRKSFKRKKNGSQLTRVESKIDLLLIERGISWSADISKSYVNDSPPASSKRFTFALTGRSIVRFVIKNIHSIEKGMKAMNLLKNSTVRKIIYLLLGGLVTYLNETYGLNLSADDTMALWGVIVALVTMEAHFNVKKFISGLLSSVKDAAEDATTTKDGQPIQTITAPPMTANELDFYIESVHTKLNELYKELREGKLTDSIQDAANIYVTIDQYLKAAKLPEQKESA